MGRRGIGARPLAQVPAKPKRQPWGKRGLSRSERVIVFLETLTITAGPLAGKPFVVRPWQAEFIRAVYDPVGEDGRRRVRTALLSMGRKNGKSGLAAGLALAHLCGPEAEPRGQLYSCAADREQASIMHSEMAAMIMASPFLSARCNIRQHTRDITDAVTGSRYKAMSSDAKLAHGYSPSFVVYDELAQAQNRRLFDALATGTAGRAEPLMVVISTQAEDDHHIMSEQVDYAARIAAGELDDPTFYGKVYTVPIEADPWDEANWHLANPALGDFRSLEEMRVYAKRAKHTPALEASFRSLYLNQRVAAEAGLFGPADWAACHHPVDPDSLRGQRCYGGLDLSLTKDLSAFALYFPASGVVLCWFWLPADGLAEREDQDGVPWRLWCSQGHLEATPGRTVDKRVLAQRIGEICSAFDVLSIAYDRWGFPELERAVADAGVDLPPMVEFGQGYKDMNPAVAAIEREVIEHRLKHDNPILTWCARNTRAIVDPAGNRKLVKPQDARRRIDGIVALTMAIGIAVKEPPPVVLDFSRDLVLSV